MHFHKKNQLSRNHTIYILSLNNFRNHLISSKLAENTKLRSDYSDYNKSRRQEVRTENASLREQQRSTTADLRSKQKAETSRLKEEYENKYISELESIRSNAKYLKPTKKKK